MPKFIFRILISIIFLRYGNPGSNIVPIRKIVNPTCASRTIQSFLSLNGINVDLLTISLLHNVDENNLVNLKEIKQILAEFGVMTTGVCFKQLNVDELDRLPFPFITHQLKGDNKEGHFIVVLGIENDQILIIDDGEEIIVSPTNFISEWTRNSLILEEITSSTIKWGSVQEPVHLQFGKIPSGYLSRFAYLVKNNCDETINITGIEESNKLINVKPTRESLEPGSIASLVISVKKSLNNSVASILKTASFTVQYATPESSETTIDVSWKVFPTSFCRPRSIVIDDMIIREERNGSFLYFVSNQVNLSRVDVEPSNKYPVTCSITKKESVSDEMDAYTINYHLGPFLKSDAVKIRFLARYDDIEKDSDLQELSFRIKPPLTVSPSAIRFSQTQPGPKQTILFNSISKIPFDLEIIKNPLPEEIHVELIKDSEFSWKAIIEQLHNVPISVKSFPPPIIELKSSISDQSEIKIPIILVN